MQALVFNGPGQKRLEDRPKPAVNLPSDAITRTTTCGTDQRIFKGAFAKAAETQALKVIIEA